MKKYRDAQNTQKSKLLKKMNEQVLKQIVAKPSSLQKSDNEAQKLAFIRKSFSEGQPNRSIPIKFEIQLKLNGVKR